MSDQMCGGVDPLKRVREHLEGEGRERRGTSSNQSVAQESFRSASTGANAGREAEFAAFQAANLAVVPMGANVSAWPAHPRGDSIVQPRAAPPHAGQAAAGPGPSWAAEYNAMGPTIAHAPQAQGVHTPFMPHHEASQHHAAAAPAYMPARFPLPGIQAQSHHGFVRGLAPAPVVAAAPAPAQNVDLESPETQARFEAAFAALEAQQEQQAQQQDQQQQQAQEAPLYNDDQEFAAAMDEWMGEHGRRTDDEIIEDLAAQYERAELNNNNSDEELSRVAGQIVGRVGNDPTIGNSGFMQLMRGIFAGDVVIDDAQTGFVDSATHEPLRPAAGDHNGDNEPRESVHPSLSGAHQAQGQSSGSGH